jgi:hypothetical protein
MIAFRQLKSRVSGGGLPTGADQEESGLFATGIAVGKVSSAADSKILGVRNFALYIQSAT